MLPLATGHGISTAPAVDAVRLSLHVAAAAVWVGGQFTLAGLVPTARKIGEEAPRTLARAFQKIMWPAFVVLVATGIWNVTATSSPKPTSVWQAILGVKIVVVLISGAAAFIHTRAKSKGAIAAWGGISGLSAVVALVLGVVLAG